MTIGIDKVPGTDYKIYQDKTKFSYGTDAVFISEFSRPKGVVVDLGTGTGIIPIRIFGRKKNIKKIYGIEIQEYMADLAKKSVALNNLEDKIEIINMDMKDIEERFEKHSVDTVISNPPYMKKGNALLNADENFSISRHEIKIDLEGIIKTADYLLNPHGRFYMVHRPDRLVDIFSLMRQYKIEPKRLRLVQAKEDKEVNLILVEGVKHGRPELRIDKNLIVYKEDSTYTEEIMELYYK